MERGVKGVSFLLRFLLFLLGGAFLGQRALHNARRWAGSDWSDD